jgi:hypothetical protein
MPYYFGIVIKQSLSNQDILDNVDLKATKVIGSWDFLLVSIEEEKIEDIVRGLQQSMINIEVDCWYNHFFKENQLIVVFQNRIFKETINPESWEEIIEYGVIHGIPLKQLDFNPRTVEDAYKFFELTS